MQGLSKMIHYCGADLLVDGPVVRQVIRWVGEPVTVHRLTWLLASAAVRGTLSTTPSYGGLVGAVSLTLRTADPHWHCPSLSLESGCTIEHIEFKLNQATDIDSVYFSQGTQLVDNTTLGERKLVKHDLSELC